jgi:hypothetical protein
MADEKYTMPADTPVSETIEDARTHRPHWTAAAAQDDSAADLCGPVADQASDHGAAER